MAKNLPASPEHIERYVEQLFDWVILRISEAKKASQNYFRDPRESYTPLPSLDNLICVPDYTFPQLLLSLLESLYYSFSDI